MDNLIVIPTGGLGNYLRVIFSYLCKAREQGKSLIVYWQRTSQCNGLYRDLFKPVKDLTVVYRRPKGKVTYKGCSPCCFTNTMYDELQPLPKIEEQIKAKVDSFGSYIALHIRRTDHVQLVKKKSTYTPDSTFYNFVEQYPCHNIYLATDNALTQEQFVQRYGNRVKWYQPIKDSTNLRQTSLQHAVIDIFIAVHADAFKGTNYSSFSDTIDRIRNATHIEY